MANSLNLNSSINGNVNGLTISENSSVSLVPSGSAAFAESLLITTGVYQLVTTGSGFGNVGVIYAANTSPSGSIVLAVSASGAVSALGTILPNLTNSTATAINWNGPLSGLYATSLNSSSYGVFVVVSQ